PLLVARSRPAGYAGWGMLAPIRFLWNAGRGHRLRPWRSAWLRWRIETYSGIEADSLRMRDVFRFTWRERGELLRFLAWTQEMKSCQRHSLHPVESGQAGPTEETGAAG
ncbi:MAG: hypothetical protein ACREPW_08150, partial [Candidatus Binataceae bacterium]